MTPRDIVYFYILEEIKQLLKGTSARIMQNKQKKERSNSILADILKETFNLEFGFLCFVIIVGSRYFPPALLNN